MKLWIFSDLHLETELFDKGNIGPLPEADVCVVAGDLKNSCSQAVRWLERMIACSGMPVAFVAGNHEFYGNSVTEGLEWGRQAAAEAEGVHLLNDNAVVLGGVRFLGCTLWTDYALDGDPERDMAKARFLLYDHRAIAWRRLPSHEPFTPTKARELHQRSREFLWQALREPFDGPTVVISHHAPHLGSINARFKDSALNPAFASDLGELMELYRPKLWVHGHMHDPCDYVVGDTRVLCNPKGYGNENKAFKPRLVVEV